MKRSKVNGEINPSKLLEIWETKKGLPHAFSVKQRKILDQYFTGLQSIDTSKTSEIGNIAMALRGGGIVMAMGAGALAGGLKGGQAGAAAGGLAGTIFATVGMHQFVKKVLLSDGEFARAALRLSKSTAKDADPADVRKVLTALHGTKMILQDQNGTIIETEARVDFKRNRSFRTPNQYETDVLRNTGKFKKTRRPGFGTLGAARR